MKCAVLLLLLFINSSCAAPEVRVRPSEAKQEQCATYIDEGCFGDVSLYKAHYNAYYRNMTTNRTCMKKRSKRDIYKDAMDRMERRRSHWKNNAIPYLISCDYTESERIFIANAFMAFESRTCLKFVPYNGNGNGFVYLDANPPTPKCAAAYDIGSPITYNGKEQIYVPLKYRRDCFHSGTNGKGSVIHELMHVLGFIHQHDRREANPNYGGRYPPEYVTIGPYDRFSASSYNWTRELTDLDALKINRLYNCSRTTRGNLAIDLSKPTSLPKRLTGPITTVEMETPWGKSKVYKNIAQFTVDEINGTLTLDNQFNEELTICEIDEECYLPSIEIGAINNIQAKVVLNFENGKFYRYVLGNLRNGRNSYFTDEKQRIPECIAVIQGNIAPGRGGERYICLTSENAFKLVVNNRR